MIACIEALDTSRPRALESRVTAQVTLLGIFWVRHLSKAAAKSPRFGHRKISQNLTPLISRSILCFSFVNRETLYIYSNTYLITSE
jgi:hypothetical protein